MKRDLGKAAESKFVSWCSDVGITINKAEEDKHGWDFLLELPVDRTTGSAFDLHKANMICKVQVKATEGKKLSRSVELSNLHALATDPLPVFYLFLHFESGSSPVDAYFLHMDEALIRRVLKSAREHISNGEGAKLNGKTLTLKYGKSERLAECSGQGLLGFLEHNFYACWSSLVTEKQATLQTAGFEDGMASISFTITGNEQRENLITGSLGYENQISVSDFLMFHQRFGIKDSTPSIDAREALIRITGAGYKEAKVMFICSGAETLVLQAKVYFSPLIDDFSKALFRIATDFFDIRVNAGAKKVDFKSQIDDDKYYSVVQLRKVLLFIEAILEKRQDVGVLFDVDGKFLKVLDAHTNPVGQSFERLSMLLDCLSNVLRESFDISGLTVSANWLRSNSKSLIELDALRRGQGKFKLKFTPDNQSHQGQSVRAHFFHYREIVIEGVCYLFVFSASCGTTVYEDGVLGFVGDFRLARELEGPNDESWIENSLSVEGGRLANELIEIGDVYCEDFWFDPSCEYKLMIRTK